MEFVIITGQSGSGKSQTVNVLEDAGFFCIDNMPPQLIPKFAEMCKEYANIEKIAIVTDIRGGSLFLDLQDNVKKLKENDIDLKILFVSTEHDEIKRRYKETRRKHPLLDVTGGDIDKAIDAEYDILSPIRMTADYFIDTTHMTTNNLREAVRNLFVENVSDTILISCISFGFMYGIPAEADLVFDVRCMPNPFHVPELREFSGLDRCVQDFVMSHEVSVEMKKKMFDIIDFLLPQYITEGKSQLNIAIGCTGGRHRSVTYTQLLYKHLEENGYKVRVLHRDIAKRKN
ncbi:MAG TPA: RNase adapter RapZ [Ruminococcaceae bacterium]|nr:RNase adapter RapZ [Oscillospiraceae bacterium]